MCFSWGLSPGLLNFKACPLFNPQLPPKTCPLLSLSLPFTLTNGQFPLLPERVQNHPALWDVLIFSFLS